MKIILNLYKCGDYIVASETGQDYVIVEKEGEFFRLTNKQFIEMFGQHELIYMREQKENIFCMVLFVMVITAAVMGYFGKTSYLLVDQNIAKAGLLLIINIPLHEAGHIMCLKFFYPESKIKMGMKFTFIYPSFYVDTSYSYLLSKSKKVSVHLAGNFMNSLFVIIILLAVPQLVPYLYLIVSNILINFIPIIKSDGYYALASACNWLNLKKTKKANLVEELVRGVIMFSILELLTILF